MAGLSVRRTVMGTDGVIVGHEDQVNGYEFNAVTFSNEREGEESTGHVLELTLNENDWVDLGSPHEITVEVRPGNTLQEEG